MRFFALARLSTCALLCLSPVLLGHCGGATNEGLMGTETGNPPVVDSQRLRLVAGELGPVLVGDPGAVPGGAAVRLDNRSTGDSLTMTANADGSFRLSVSGALSDTYEVTVTHRGGTVTLSVAVEASDGAGADAGPAPGDPACNQLQNSLDAQLRPAVAPFAAGCTNDDDCSILYWSMSCYSGCGYSYVATGQGPAAAAAGEQSISPACSEIERLGCTPSEPPVCNAGYGTPMCHRGICQGTDYSSLSCDDLAERAGNLIRRASETTDRNCSIDADCAMVSLRGLSCTANCGYLDVAAATASEDLQQKIEGIEDTVCGTFSERGCPPPLPPSCPFLPAQRAVCSQNRCTVVVGL